GPPSPRRTSCWKSTWSRRERLWTCLASLTPRSSTPRFGRRLEVTGSRNLRDAEDAASFFVALFQLQRHREVVGQPQGQRRQRLAQRQCPRPGFEQPGVAVGGVATGHGVQRRRFIPEGGIRLADQFQQVAVQIEVACGDQVDDRDGYAV